MKSVEIYDQFSNVYDTNGVTLLHVSSGYTIKKGIFNSQQEANELVYDLYEESKLLGTYEDRIIKLNEGYAELKITFSDGRKLNRVIYTEEK